MLREYECRAEWQFRVAGLGEEPLEAMSAVLFSRLDDVQLNEYLRLLRDVIRTDRVSGFSPQQLYDLAVTAVFNTTEEA